MSTFDPNQFMETKIDQPLDDKIIPVPEGEYTAQIESVTPKKVTTDEGDRLVFDLTWNIHDEEVKKTTGRDKNTVRQSIWVELTEDGQSLDGGKGKNVQLGKVRTALNQNKKNKEWSPKMMEGQMANIRVRHKPNPKGDGSDPYDVFPNVVNVAAM